MKQHPAIAGQMDRTTADGDEVLMQLVNERVGRAAHELTRFPDRTAAVARSLIADVTAAPEECLERAVADLRSLTAHT